MLQYSYFIMCVIYKTLVGGIYRAKSSENILIDLDATKPVFVLGLRTTKAQTSLRIRADWSAHLLFAFWKVSKLATGELSFL